MVDEIFTPPLGRCHAAGAEGARARPDLLFFLPTVISDASWCMEKMNGSAWAGQGAGHLVGIAIAEPDMLRTMSPELLQGVMSAVGSWGSRAMRT